jgi:hypothetical protein
MIRLRLSTDAHTYIEPSICTGKTSAQPRHFSFERGYDTLDERIGKLGYRGGLRVGVTP